LALRVLPVDTKSTIASADAIVDLVSTGNTLKANHLVEVERIMDISSQLVVNQASLKLKHAAIQPLLAQFAAALH
jgi:ATP phosphoribosyltransferase